MKEQYRDGELWLGDCLSLMADLPGESIKLIVTSPPYNLGDSISATGLIKWKQKGRKEREWIHPLLSGYDGYDDAMPHHEYVAWQRECLGEMMRLLRPDGAIFYVHKWRVQNGLLQDRGDIVAGFPVRQIIIWDRGPGFNFNKRHFLPAYEVIYFVAKPGFELAPQANRMSTIWRMLLQPQRRETEHPAPFPVELPSRAISAVFGPEPEPDACVLDPFIGGGTTAIAAMKHGIRYLGMEQSPHYFEMAGQRIAAMESQGRLL